MSDAPAPAPDAGLPPEARSGLPWMVGTKLLLMAVYFYISVLTVRRLGAERYGLFSLCRSAAEVLAVFCGLGLNIALQRFIPELVVQRNRAGLRRLLARVAALQAGAAAVAVGALYLAAPLLERRYRVPFTAAAVLTGLLVGAQLAKTLVNDAFTALFRTRTVTLLSAAQALLWALLLRAALAARPDVAAALGAQAASLLVVAAAGTALLVRALRAMRGRSPPAGIGRRRALALSIPTMLNSAFRMLMLKYTEVFFIGLYYPAAAVGLYDLGYTTPQMALTLIPVSVQTLLTSAFAHAYARDPECLPGLIRSVYKMLILATVPFAAFGVFFSARGIVALYGESMAGAGPIAAAFCVLHTLPMVSMPLSMAVTARERVLRMLPYMAGQVAVNIGFDLWLIPRWGLWGGVAAVALTWIVTIPFRVRAVRGIVGDIPFPTAFLLRAAALAAVLAGALRALVPSPGLVELAALAAVFCAAYPLLARHLGVLRAEDAADLRAVLPDRLHRAVNALAGRAAGGRGNACA